MVDGLDLDALARFMAPWTEPARPDPAGAAGGPDPAGAARGPDPAGAAREPVPLSAEPIPGGKSNLTYRLSDGARQWVLRRPPLGHVLATAHDMAREYRVMSALAQTPVPVPRMVALCEDPAVIGAPFYVMDMVEGSILRSSADTADLAGSGRATLAHRLMDTLADLHEVDPVAVGLGDFGHPDGFLERQVRRWNQQLERSRTRDLPGIDELARVLAAEVPRSQRASIVHGDYRLDNILVGPDQDVRAVLDWEMATLGDPLCDLGLLAVYALPLPEVAGAVTDGMGLHNGFPSLGSLVDRYAARTGLDVGHLSWYTALGYYKLAVICEGIHCRFVAGQTRGPGFDRIGSVVAPLVVAGRDTLHRLR